MTYLLIPYAALFALYIRQENCRRFRTATALKVILTSMLAVCLFAAAVRAGFAPELLLPALGMCAAVAGDFYLQYIQRDAAKFRRGILAFSLTQILYLVTLGRLYPFHWSSLAVFGALLLTILALKVRFRWDTAAVDPWLSLYTGLVALTAGKCVSVAVVAGTAGAAGLLTLGGVLFYLSDLVLGIWNYQKSHILLADLNWLLYFAAQFLLAAGFLRV